MRLMGWGLPLMAALSMVSPPLADAASSTVEEGGTVATLRYSTSSDGPDPRLRIERLGVTIEDATLSPLCRFCIASPLTYQRDPLRVRDVDDDGEPEVFVDLYTGGAHCCQYVVVFRYRPVENDYVSVTKDFGNGSYALRDFDQDGVLEWRSTDDRFAYAFTAYAYSLRPIQIWRFTGGVFRDVTRAHRREIRRDARRAWGLYQRADKRNTDVRGILAAFMADKYLLGQARQGWRKVRRVARLGQLRDPSGYGIGATDGAYIKKLRRFLRRTGYAG